MDELRSKAEGSRRIRQEGKEESRIEKKEATEVIRRRKRIEFGCKEDKKRKVRARTQDRSESYEESLRERTQ